LVCRAPSGEISDLECINNHYYYEGGGGDGTF